MPRKRKSTQNNSSLFQASQRSDEEDMVVVETCNIQSQVAQMNGTEFNRKVRDTVRFILFHNKKGPGIKKPDLVKSVMKDHPAAFSKIFEAAKIQIKETFGYEVVQMFSEDGKPKGYILVNALESGVGVDWEEKDGEKMALLMIVMSMIFMNEGVITEHALWVALKKLSIHKSRHHTVFGDAEKLINVEFVRQCYLERKKVTAPEGVSHHYLLGARGKREVSKRRLLEFVTEVYGVESINVWKMQHQDVLREEGVNEGTQGSSQM